MVADVQRKVSRYRSQRQKAQQEAAQDDAPDVPEMPVEPAQDDNSGMARSRSRYHRKNTVTSRPGTSRNPDAQSPPPTTRSPPARQEYVSPTRSPPERYNTQKHRQRHMSPQAEPGAQESRRAQDDHYDSGVEYERKPSNPVPVSALSRHQSPPSQPTAELFPPLKPVPSPQPVRRDGPPTSDQIHATKDTSEQPAWMEEEGAEGDGGCFGLFRRKREPAPTQKQTPIARPTSSKGPQAILAGGGGVVPGTDAPISAVNAGDRRVLVECGRSKMLFPVTPATTPVELIRSAATTLSERIDVKSAVMLEYFGSVGVQRPLRRYEHVRDVMNSWDTDRQNSLLIVDPGTGKSEVELSLAGVPKLKPSEASWLLTYSQKPGKWDKRLITLREDGQITCQKDSSSTKDLINICHLSDFDMYTPTQEKIKKKIKPPKRLCFAIKSQQKSSMFESTQNFVHFFCTNDRQTGDDFHDAVQAWRSWYLVHVMGEGKKTKPIEEKPEIGNGGISTGFAAQGHKKMDSMESHYQLGSFKPLMDVGSFDRRPATSDGRNQRQSMDGYDRPATGIERGVSTRRKEHPPAALKQNVQLKEDEPLANLAKRPSNAGRRGSMDQTRQEFASNGLLGRTYSQRQRDNAEREAKREQPFTGGSNLLNNGYGEDALPRGSLDGPRRQPSTRQNNDMRRNMSKREPGSHRRGGSVDLQRSGSRAGAGARDMPKPLVDLTPQYKEPPQHWNKGKGHKMDQTVGGPLVEAATSPEDPLGIPPSTDWRGRNAGQSVSPHGRQRSQSRPQDRQDYIGHSKSQRRPTTARSPDNNSPFTGEGLLAGPQAQQGWGGGDRGRGVVDGRHAKGPLVDMSQESKFAQGSLLRDVERVRPDGPIIDRG